MSLYKHHAGAWVPISQVSSPTTSYRVSRASVDVVATPPVNRAALVRGAYIPGPTTTGPLPHITSFTQLTGTQTLADNNIVLDGYEIWGQVLPRVISGNTPILRNCILRGKPPAQYSTGLDGVIKAYGNGYGHITLENCIIDPMGWFDVKGYDPTQMIHLRNTTAIHGSDYDMHWCEVTNVQDGLNIVGHTPRTSGGDPNERWLEVDRSWIHKGYYMNPWSAVGDGQPHCDAIQTNTGKNLTFWGNMLGGQRNMTGYQTWPGGYNSGDDFWNAGIMLQQEVNANYANLIENVRIEDNVIGGGTASLNHSNKYSNPWTGLSIRRNRFLQRSSNWGQTLNNGNPTNQGAGYYILRPSIFADRYSQNTILETGANAPITNGA